MTYAQPMQVDALDWSALDLDPASRIHRLREAYWNGTYRPALVRKRVAGCGQDTLTGYARDFAALLEASDPFIQPDELIVGCRLAIPEDPEGIHLGYYNRHYPPGHETILRKGLPGIRDEARARLRTETDPDKQDFLRAVEVAYDAACTYVRKYAEAAEKMAAVETDPERRGDLGRVADVCRELAQGAPSSFHAALQLFQFTRVLGGRGCVGRFDQWMGPFLRQDIDAGRLSPQEAQELLECLFIKMNEFADVDDLGRPAYVHNDDLRNIALAGQTRRGEDACNELTYMCLQASARLMLPEPKLNVRFFHGSPRRLLHACCQVLSRGANVLAIFNDEVVLPALSRLGIPLEEARDYCNDGCSELIMGGKGTIHFWVHDSLTPLREAVLQAKERPYATFDELMAEFKVRLEPYMPEGHGQDSAITFPFFAASIEDCLAKASPTGARYSIWGSILAEVGNAADGLAAIRSLIYEQGTLTWDELVSAIEADYQGHESLRQRLLNRAPKYGNDDDRADLLAKEIAEYFCDGVHARANNPLGPGSKRAAGLMCFGIQAKSQLPASPDGRRQGDPCANSFSPAVGMDRSGPTAVLKSVSKVDLTKASHGSVLDIALHASVFRGQEGMAKVAAFVDAFLKLGCTATLQVNVIDRDTLLKAREDPNSPEFRTLIVRVWGFSAVFVELPVALQDHVLARTEHGV
jgi:pyruvate-formate lyase